MSIWYEYGKFDACNKTGWGYWSFPIVHWSFPVVTGLSRSPRYGYSVTQLCAMIAELAGGGCCAHPALSCLRLRFIPPPTLASASTCGLAARTNLPKILPHQPPCHVPERTFASALSCRLSQPCCPLRQTEICFLGCCKQARG